MAELPAYAEMLRIDREDLFAVLTMRFGAVPEPVRARIAVCHDAATLERLILAAANAPSWDQFMGELRAGAAAFRLAGRAPDPAGGTGETSGPADGGRAMRDASKEG